MTEGEGEPGKGPLAGLKVLDLSRVLAGPWASQILADLGAKVFKIEQPGSGDDTRRWGPPFIDNPDGSHDAAYYQCCNRNKHSLAIDLASLEGAHLVRQLASQCDIVLENFRVGGLAKYGLDYESLSAINPTVIYASITGFGQTGPLKDQGGYDFLIQGMSGLMSVTGMPDSEGGAPTKVGVPTCDLSTGLYAAISILAALHHRTRTGEGQHIDCALLDTQISLLANQASNHLIGGAIPKRLGNQHPNVVPYQDFQVADGRVLVALGNDQQYRAFCTLLRAPELGDDPRFATNRSRNEHRDDLISQLAGRLASWSSDELISAMSAAKLPGGRINDIPAVLSEPHVAARGLVHEMIRGDGIAVRVVGFPHQLSKTPARYDKAPPLLGEDTSRVLSEELGLLPARISALVADGVISVSNEA